MYTIWLEMLVGMYLVDSFLKTLHWAHFVFVRLDKSDAIIMLDKQFGS